MRAKAVWEGREGDVRVVFLREEEQPRQGKGGIKRSKEEESYHQNTVQVALRPDRSDNKI